MLEKFINPLKDALFPRGYTCDVCGRETFGTNLCSDCERAVIFNNGDACPICGRMTLKPEICRECKESLPSFKKAISPLVYDGAAIALVTKFKNGGAYLKEYFADLICKKLDELPKTNCIVYVPMTKKSQNKRGYNQVKLLAKAISKRTNIPVLKDAVIKVKETAVQKGLSQKERESNLDGCFKVTDKTAVAGKSVLCIDDVLTTGATAEEICKTLLKAGADCVYFATVASVEDKAQKRTREENEKRLKEIKKYKKKAAED
ncbi:MAG: ComF family protein [Clostridia bacterium]|nr:ComF family protein [Clostridia bacterium]